MERKVSLGQLMQIAGVSPLPNRPPCLPAPSQPALFVTDDDRAQARNILVDRRKHSHDHKDAVLKRLFRSSKDKDKQDPAQWEFSQDELDQALSAAILSSPSNPGLIQGFLSLGAKVNYVETLDKKKSKHHQPNPNLRRRSTVLQQAATARRADSVSLLASSGADQTTLDESLKAALAVNDKACVQQLMQHGADVNRYPNSLANAVQSNDQNLVQLLLRSPKAIRPDIISTCLAVAVQQASHQIASLLIVYGADPNFNSSSALNMAIGKEDYKMAVTLVAGPIPLTPHTLQRLLDTVMRLRTCEATLHFIQLLFCCGLPPNSIGLPDLLICTSRKNNTAGSLMMISFGVSTKTNEAECLRLAISNSNWLLVDAILETPIEPQQASAALATLPMNTPQSDRLRIIRALVQKGASGRPLSRWLTCAIEEGDNTLVDLLLGAGAPVAMGDDGPLQLAVKRKDIRSLRMLLNTRPSPEVLAKLFPLMRTGSGHSPSERLDISRLLLEQGAHGAEVDQALIDAVADTSSARDVALITELVQHGANVNYNNGKSLSLAVTQANLPMLRLLCSSNPTTSSTSIALPLAFDTQGGRHSTTLPLIELLLSHGVEEQPALQALRLAISGGPDNLDIIQQLLAASTRLLGPAFEYTIALEDTNKKAPILEALLKMGIPQDALDKALVVETQYAATNKDVTTAKALMGQGASVSGEGLSVAVASGNILLTNTLLSGSRPPSRSSITKAFRTMFLDENLQGLATDPQSIFKIASQLLCLGVEQPAIDSALRAVLHAPGLDVTLEAFVDLLLEHGADVNSAEGACFLFAAKKQDRSIFEKLIIHRPSFRLVVPALLSSKIADHVAVDLMKSCFQHGCTTDELETGFRPVQKTPVLISAINEYPRCAALMKLLLDHGCNPDVACPDVIDSELGEETLPALLWALLQPQKKVSDSVILELLSRASVTRASPVSEMTPLALAAREGRGGIVQALLKRGADASTRDKWNKSALFYASSGSTAFLVQALAPHALKNDGSLHEAARSLQYEAAALLLSHGHSPNFPSRLHGGRSALGELCLHAEVVTASQRTRARQLINLFLENGADSKFRARNEKSSVILSLENENALEMTEALLETDVWEHINDEKHMYVSSGLWYSPLKYVELIPSPSRTSQKQQLLDLLRDKGCEPKFYSETAEQPDGAIGLPASVARLVDRQKEHHLSLKHAKEIHENTRTMEETSHRDLLRRKREQQEAELATQSTTQAHWQNLEQKKHDFEVQRVQAAERMKRTEKAAWHNLLLEQEREAGATKQTIENRKAAIALANERELSEQRKKELDHRVGWERRMLKEKEELYERNVGRQKDLTKRLDESAQLHAKLRQERPAIEGPPQWGTVD
jgi:ankyrin repeat protein